jgi:hypothetical protein
VVSYRLAAPVQGRVFGAICVEGTTNRGDFFRLTIQKAFDVLDFMGGGLTSERRELVRSGLKELFFCGHGFFTGTGEFSSRPSLRAP